MHGEIIAGVFGKPGDSDYVLLVPHPMDKPSLAYVVDNGLEYCGAMGFINGECVARCCENEQAVQTMASAVPAFALYVRSKIKGTELPYKFAANSTSVN